MAHGSDFSDAHRFILQTYRYYSGLMQTQAAERGEDAVEGLGGQLFWAGEFDVTGRALTIAANIAGAATLTATDNPDAQRSAVRDGVVDFLVNSLDEALRILKNEVRKRETVAVCVAAPLEAVEREMVERGVRPDVFREGVLRAVEVLAEREKNQQIEPDAMETKAVVTWRVDRAPAVWLPKMDAVALECVAPDESVARRWLQRAHRFLGRLGREEHLVVSNREFAARFMERFEAAREKGQIGAGGRIEIASSIGRDSCTFEGPDDADVTSQS